MFHNAAAHCTLHTAHCTLHTAHCTLHTAHCTHCTHCTAVNHPARWQTAGGQALPDFRVPDDGPEEVHGEQRGQGDWRQVKGMSLILGIQFLLAILKDEEDYDIPGREDGQELGQELLLPALPGNISLPSSV